MGRVIANPHVTWSMMGVSYGANLLLVHLLSLLFLAGSNPDNNASPKDTKLIVFMVDTESRHSVPHPLPLTPAPTIIKLKNKLNNPMTMKNIISRTLTIFGINIKPFIERTYPK
jgi:hypothetical protein